MENNKNKKSVKFQGDMLNFCDFIQVYVFTTNHHLKQYTKYSGVLQNCDCIGVGRFGIVGGWGGARLRILGGGGFPIIT